MDLVVGIYIMLCILDAIAVLIDRDDLCKVYVFDIIFFPGWLLMVLLKLICRKFSKVFGFIYDILTKEVN